MSEPVRKKQKNNWPPKKVKIKVDKSPSLFPWTIYQGPDDEGETFNISNTGAPDLNDTLELEFIKQLLRVAVSAGKSSNDKEYKLRYAACKYRLSKDFDTETKMITFAKSKDKQWLEKVYTWMKEGFTGVDICSGQELNSFERLVIIPL